MVVSAGSPVGKLQDAVRARRDSHDEYQRLEPTLTGARGPVHASAHAGARGLGADAFVAALAEMDEQRAKALWTESNAKRRGATRQRRDDALRQAWRDFYPDLGASPAAIELERAARGHRAPRNLSVAAQADAKKRPAVRSWLIQRLGNVDEVPSAHRIRQLFDNT